MAKSLKYRLQIVLDKKLEARDEAARYLAEMRAGLKKEQEKEEALREDLRLNRERAQKENELLTGGDLRAGLDVRESQQRLDYIKFLDFKGKQLEGEIATQVRRVEKTKRIVEEALQDLIRASRELQVMEKHKERWLIKAKKVQELEEQNETNEIGNIVYSHHQRSIS